MASQGTAEEDTRDEVTRGRESFLNIYKDSDENAPAAEEDTDLSGGIKFKRDEDEEDAFKMRTSKDEPSGKRPLIQELD